MISLSTLYRISSNWNALCSTARHLANLPRPLSIHPNRELSRTIQSNLIQVTFIRGDGSRLVAFGRDGDSLLDVVRDSDLDLDGFGACDGELSCCSCHLVLHEHDFNQLPNPPCEQELDMLEMAGQDLRETSRLGCRIYLREETMKDGLEVCVPNSTDARLF